VISIARSQKKKKKERKKNRDCENPDTGPPSLDGASVKRGPRAKSARRKKISARKGCSRNCSGTFRYARTANRPGAVRSTCRQRNEQLSGLLFAISFSRCPVHVSPPRSICSLLDQKNVFETLRSRGHTAAGALFMTTTSANRLPARFSATGNIFLYARRNDIASPPPLYPTVSLLRERLRYTLRREIIALAYAAYDHKYDFNGPLV